jgi:hypothetical protein
MYNTPNSKGQRKLLTPIVWVCTFLHIAYTCNTSVAGIFCCASWRVYMRRLPSWKLFKRLWRWYELTDWLYDPAEGEMYFMLFKLLPGHQSVNCFVLIKSHECVEK